MGRAINRPVTAAGTNRSSSHRVRGDQFRCLLAPSKPMKLVPFYPGANNDPIEGSAGLRCPLGFCAGELRELVQCRFERYWDTAAAVGFFRRRRNSEIPDELYYDY